MEKKEDVDMDEESHVHTRSLEGELRVLYAQQLFRKIRVKRRPERADEAFVNQVRAKRSAVEMEEVEFARRILAARNAVEDRIGEELLQRLVVARRAAEFNQRLLAARNAVGAEEADRLEDERGIPARLLALWDEEERKYGKGDQKPPNPRDSEFNDLLWDHQWYMVSQFNIFARGGKQQFSSLSSRLQIPQNQLNIYRGTPGPGPACHPSA